MFTSPVTAQQVTAAITAGSTVITAPGSVVDRATTDVASIANAAVVQGVLPAGVPYANASVRASTGGASALTIPASSNASTQVLQPNLGFRYLLRNFILSCNTLGLHSHNLYRTNVNGTRGANLFAAFADTSKNPLLYTFNYIALGFNEGLEYQFSNASASIATAIIAINYDLINA